MADALTPGYVTFLLGAAYLGFLASSVTGIGGALLLTPVLMLRLPAADAIGLTALVVLGNNLLRTWAFGRHADLRFVGLAFVGAVPCAIWAATLTGSVDERLLRAVVALLVLGSLGSQWLGRPLRVPRCALPAAGAAFGFVSGLAGMGGTVAALVAKGYELTGPRFVGTMALMALGMLLVKIPTYYLTGVLVLDRWPLVLALIATALAGVLTARRVHHRLAPATFRRLLDALLVVVAGLLLADALG